MTNHTDRDTILAALRDVLASMATPRSRKASGPWLQALALVQAIDAPKFKLVHTRANTEAKIGDALVSFRGEGATLTYISKRGNKVCVRWDGDESDIDSEYYPSVFDMHFERA